MKYSSLRFSNRFDLVLMVSEIKNKKKQKKSQREQKGQTLKMENYFILSLICMHFFH